MLYYNYHTHTYMCGHASGAIEEYIIRAIENGIKYMGFADHTPYISSDGTEEKFRVKVSDVRDYFSEISALREKYKDKIEINIGFEMEYFPEQFSQMLDDVIAYGAEYLILGPHYYKHSSVGGIHAIKETDSAIRLQKYVENVVEGIKTGFFSYVAHPDVLNFVGDMSEYKKEMRKICIASKEYNIPLEINFLGIRDHRHYPNEAFWEIAGKEQSPVTFGFDAHNPQSAFDGNSLEKAKQLLDKYGLNYIGKADLILLQNIDKKVQ